MSGDALELLRVLTNSGNERVVCASKASKE